MPIMKRKGVRAALLLAACCYLTPALADPLPCDDGIKTAFRPDADTSVVAVWVEKGAAPGELLLTSRDNSLSYPVCVYPLRTTWNGNGDARQASSYGCR